MLPAAFLLALVDGHYSATFQTVLCVLTHSISKVTSFTANMKFQSNLLGILVIVYLAL